MKNTDLKLINPTIEFEPQIKDIIKEYKYDNSKMNGAELIEEYDNYLEWLEYIENNKTNPITNEKVPSSTFFLIDFHNIIIGFITIRHVLNERYSNSAGNIGYSIRPKYRQKGYGNLILSLGLKKSKELGLEKVLLTVRRENIASKKIIENNNGIYIEDKKSPRNGLYYHHYIIKVS